MGQASAAHGCLEVLSVSHSVWPLYLYLPAYPPPRSSTSPGAGGQGSFLRIVIPIYQTCRACLTAPHCATIAQAPRRQLLPVSVYHQCRVTRNAGIECFCFLIDISLFSVSSSSLFQLNLKLEAAHSSHIYSSHSSQISHPSPLPFTLLLLLLLLIPCTTQGAPDTVSSEGV